MAGHFRCHGIPVKILFLMDSVPQGRCDFAIVRMVPCRVEGRKRPLRQGFPAIGNPPECQRGEKFCPDGADEKPTRVGCQGEVSPGSGTPPENPQSFGIVGVFPEKPGSVTGIRFFEILSLYGVREGLKSEIFVPEPSNPGGRFYFKKFPHREKKCPKRTEKGEKKRGRFYFCLLENVPGEQDSVTFTSADGDYLKLQNGQQGVVLRVLHPVLFKQHPGSHKIQPKPLELLTFREPPDWGLYAHWGIFDKNRPEAKTDAGLSGDPAEGDEARASATPEAGGCSGGRCPS